MCCWGSSGSLPCDLTAIKSTTIIRNLEKQFTLDDGEDNLGVAEVLAEIVDLALMLDDLRLLCAFLFRQVLHILIFNLIIQKHQLDTSITSQRPHRC